MQPRESYRYRIDRKSERVIRKKSRKKNILKRSRNSTYLVRSILGFLDTSLINTWFLSRVLFFELLLSILRNSSILQQIDRIGLNWENSSFTQKVKIRLLILWRRNERKEEDNLVITRGWVLIPERRMASRFFDHCFAIHSETRNARYFWIAPPGFSY